MSKYISDNKIAYKYLLTGQVLLFFFLFICLLLNPRFLFTSNEGGISNYGLYAKTVIPFSLSTISGAGLAIVASLSIVNDRLKLLIRLWAGLALSSLVSTYPYKINHVYRDIHIYLSLILLIYEVCFCSYLVFRLVEDKINLAFWFLMIATLILGILDAFKVVHLLYVIEVVEGLAFAVILVRSVKYLPEL